MGLYTIITRADGTVLTGAGSTSNIFNVDHQNHVTHTEPTSINSFEATVAQMNIEVDPSPNGVPSLPAAFSDELARLRFALSTLKRLIASGTAPAHWYTATGTFNAAVTLPPVAARIEQANPQTIPNGINATLVLFDTTIYSTVAGMAGTLGISLPVTGTYIVGGCLGLVLDDGDFQAIIRIPTGDFFATNEVRSTTKDSKMITVETVVHLPAGTAIQLGVIQTSLTPQDRKLRQTPSRPALWVALVGR
jgi:hypothetical protein